MENEFPPNSNSQKEERSRRRPEKETSTKREVARVTTGKVVLRKKPLYKRFIEAFRPEDNKGFVEYALLDLLVPGIKDTVADAASAAIDNALGTGVSHGRRRRSGGGGYTSYNRMGSARPRGHRDRSREDDDRRGSRHEDRSPSEHREIIVYTRVEAEEVIEQMIELIGNYDAVSKRDLLTMVGEDWEYTDEDWGWTDVRGARIHKIRDGYLIDLPRPEPLD